MLALNPHIDDITNEDFNRMLMKNVQAVVNKSYNGSSFDVVTIKRRFLSYVCCVTIQLLFLIRAVRMYFKYSMLGGKYSYT